MRNFLNDVLSFNIDFKIKSLVLQMSYGYIYTIVSDLLLRILVDKTIRVPIKSKVSKNILYYTFK